MIRPMFDSGGRVGKRRGGGVGVLSVYEKFLLSLLLVNNMHVLISADNTMLIWIALATLHRTTCSMGL